MDEQSANKSTQIYNYYIYKNKISIVNKKLEIQRVQ